MSQFSTPAPKSQQQNGKSSISPYMASSIPMERAKAVDLVTGKAIAEYFFDPSLILDENTTNGTGAATPFKTPSKSSLSKGDTADSLLFSSKHLYVPCTIVKSLQEDGNNQGQQQQQQNHQHVQGRRNNKKKNKRKNNNNNNNNFRGASTEATVMTGPALVKTSDGTLYKIQDATKLVALTSPDDYVGLNDVLHLTSVSEASLLHTLRVRYKRDAIYTNAGPILLSVNPYKQITSPNGESLYSEKMMLRYRTSEHFMDDEPHLFQVADRAYSAMMDSVHIVPHLEDQDASQFVASPTKLGVSPGQVVNQSIIISGESGAGKTEATKYIMKYLARITTKKSKWTSDTTTPFLSPDGRVVATLEDRVLSSNPLLESFGNAQTLRNDNSSRFGKFIHINFSTDKGVIVGAKISNYLLEKTRITTQIEGERNYHIFYQMFAGASPETLKHLGVEDGTEVFRYLCNRVAEKTQKDKDDFVETMACLSNIGLAGEEQKIVLGLAAAVLHLGNVTFEEAENEDHSAVVSESSRHNLSKACELLGLKEEDVTEAILTKLLTINGKSIKKPSTVAMAEDKRDALAKMTYSSLFLWLVKSINKTLSLDDSSLNGGSGTVKTGFIGVLDIYGFECFEVNGYEQLLINYCNEKLQRHFNRHLFEVEQNLYSTEGVDWTYITFNDNQPCLDLIEGGGGVVGILNTLDDSYAGMGSSDEKDVKFVAQLHKLFGSVAGAKHTNGGHDYFVTPKFGNDRQFVIVHYAGEVRYTADGFAEKNMESLSTELRDLGSSSTIPVARDVFGATTSKEDSRTLSKRSSIRGFSVSSQFKQSLQSLMDDLDSTQPHYIRCIKPNLSKAQNSFNAGEVLKQLRYSGMMEAIRIRREGYALREDHQSFFNRFSVLLGADDAEGQVGIEQLVRVLSKRLNVTDADWQIGHSKIFLRRELSDKLERLAKLRVHRAARTIGRFGRAAAQRRASTILVAWVRFRLVMLKKYRSERASSKIASTYRMHSQQKCYNALIRAAVKIQSQLRRLGAAHAARKLRDPFCDMSYKDLKNLLRAEKARMDEAAQSNDFSAAAEIEAKIDLIKIAMDERQPMTRRRLEEKIAEAQQKLDTALQRKDYKEAGPLQEDVEKLKALRTDFPTVEELKAEVKRAEDAVAEAAKNRDFAAAASLQADVNKAKDRLKEAMEDTNGSDDEADETSTESKMQVSVEGINSRADLEEEIASLHSKVDDAIAKKDFKFASELQSKIEEKEKLRSLFPSIEELEAQLLGAKGDLEEAIVKKDFTKAGTLHETIADIEKKIAAEKKKVGDSPRNALKADQAQLIGLDGNKVVFESRHALEKEINSNESLQAKEIASKNFKRAQEIQMFIERLQGLRKALPTVAELQKTIKAKRLDMNKAISEKRFADAESLDREISTLEEKLELERKDAPAASKSKPTDISVHSTPVVKPSITPKARAATVVGGVARQKPTIKPPTAIESQRSFDKSDDVSDITSVNSAKSGKRKHSGKSSKGALSKLESLGEDRPVSKLRPKKPLISSATDSVLCITQMLASKRGDASLVVNDEGGLAGIITDTDITRRLVAKHLDASGTSVSQVMTPNPTCVSMTDSAMDAMTTMVENHFRHLPVVDENGGVVGLLDIAKCLNDAISKLEKSQSKGNNAAHEALEQAMNAQGAQGAQVAALHALLGPLMTQAFGSQASPTLRSVLAGKPSTVVSPTTSLQEAGSKMAESRKAALVVEGGKLVGIFGFKDMMNRAIAKELPLEDTEISAVMTPNPESVSPDMTVLDALQTMHDNRFLTLPVCEDDGTVVGLVNVVDVIYGCGGAEGWRSIFSNTLELDDLSETGSQWSGRGSGSAGGSRSVISKKSTLSKKAQRPKDTRPVSKLRPKKPLISSTTDSVLSITQMLASKRGDASLVVNDEGGLAGIITDTDITRRLVAKHLDPSGTSVSKVMTPNPTCVSMADSAMDAMTTMVENHFRHLPVVDENGGVVGLLDIAKCLNDAISKLEKSQSKGNNAAQEALEQAMQAQGAQGAQVAALQALLGPLMTQAFGSQSSPTLRSVLAGKPSTVVSPTTSLQEAGIKMAESRKAALVVEGGKLVGIFGFKDMMNRAIAKELPLEDIEISAVMTPNPESVSPDMTVLDALQTMHDNRFLTLPVCEDDGTVVGLVNVMDVIYGCGGAEGWRSIFSNTLDLEDLSDNASQWSGRGSANGSKSVVSSRSRTKKKPREMTEVRQVSKLRPKKPLISSTTDSVLSITQMLASKRGDASLVVNDEGGLAGIITDTDITRRLVAKHLDASGTSVSQVMTPNPTCVSMTDSAMDAMTTMVENHFRHLPVVDENGGVVGLLDIAKCLNDAISKLEKSQSKGNNAAEVALEQAMNAQGAQGAQVAALHALLGPLMTQAFGSQASPTLRSVLAGKPSTVVSPTTSLQEAGSKMAESRKAALVVEGGKLVGIFGFKDMMNRAIAKELPLEDTEISAVMTPNPESVSPDMTVLDALQTMHDNRFLTLPVCEDDGTVVGLVNVMDVIYGCGGAEGWRSIFSNTLELEDLSDNASQWSEKSPVAGVVKKANGSCKKPVEKTVANLKPKKAVVSSTEDTIKEVVENLANNRADCAVLVDDSDELAGVITDTDITRRVIAKGVDPSSTMVSEVMTASPKSVQSNDSATEALVMMVQHRFRHVPVVENGAVVGVLDITKCLNDAISKLERSASSKAPSLAEDLMKQALKANGGADAAALRTLLAPLLSQAFGSEGTIPSLGEILSETSSPVLPPDSNVFDAATAMTEDRKAALVVEEEELIGVVSFRDLMNGVVAKDLNPSLTEVMEVMTPDPEWVTPNMSALEALQMMHDNKFLNLPVCRDEGDVVGLVDVMDVIHACGDAEHWRSLFEAAMDVDDVSDIQSAATPALQKGTPDIKVARDAPMAGSSYPGIPGNIPSTLEFEPGANDDFDDPTLNDTSRLDAGSLLSDDVMVFKIVDQLGHTHRLRSEARILNLRNAFAMKTNLGTAESQRLRFKFFDEEGDAILISSDEDLTEALSLARGNSGQSGGLVVKLVAESVKESPISTDQMVMAGVSAAVLAVGVGLMMMLNSKPSPSRY